MKYFVTNRFVPYYRRLFKEAGLKDKFKVSTDISKVVKALKELKQFTFDTETTGLDPRTCELLLEQYGDEDNIFVIDSKAFTGTELNPVRSLLSDPKYLKILANTGFDHRIMMHHKGFRLENTRDVIIDDIVIYNGLFDTKELSILKAENGFWRFSLAGVVDKHTNIIMDKEVRLLFTKQGDNPKYTVRQIVYAANDVPTPCIVKKIQDNLLSKYNLDAISDLENKATLGVAEMEYNGIKIDTEKWTKLYDKNIKIRRDIANKLDEVVRVDPLLNIKFGQKVQLGLFANTQGRPTNINWNSHAQVKLVFNELDLDISVKEKGVVKDSINKDVIAKHRKKHSIVPLLLDYSEISKSTSTYGIKFLENIHSVSKRIHTSFGQIKSTGRMSSSKPNLQNIKQGSDFRNCFIAEEGNGLITADYSNMELRIIADKSKDPKLIKAFNDDVDVHSFIAMLIYESAFGKKINISKKENKDIRDEYKTVTFALAFGATAFKLHEEMAIPMEDAQVVMDNYFTALPYLNKYFTGLKAYGVSHGYTKTYPPYSRIRWFPQYKEYHDLATDGHLERSEFRKMMMLKGDIERKSANTPIQGTAADIVKQAMIDLYTYYNKFNDKWNLDLRNSKRVRLCLQVHDEFVTEAGLEYCDELADKKERIMEAAGVNSVKSLRMVAEATVADHWKK